MSLTILIFVICVCDNKSFNCVHLTESLAAQEKDTGGICFVSAFQGLTGMLKLEGVSVCLSVMYR